MKRIINDGQAVLDDETGIISYGQDAVNSALATMTNQQRAEAGQAEDPNQIAAHQPMGWDELRNSAGQGLGDYYKFQPLAVNGPNDWNNYLANFESNYVKQTDGGNVLNRPWNYDADTQKQGQWLLNDFNTRYGGNKTFADLPNTQWGNSLPANHKESLMGGFMNSAFPMVIGGALGATGALSGLTGVGGLIDTGTSWLDKSILAAGKGGLSSLINGGNPLTGAAKGGLTSGFGGMFGDSTPINSVTGKTPMFDDLLDNWDLFGSGSAMDPWNGMTGLPPGNYYDDFDPSNSGFDGPNAGPNVGDLNSPLNYAPSAGGSTVGGDGLSGFLKSLFPGGVSETLFGKSGLAGGLFGDRGLLGTAAAVGPSLAAINYAKNQQLDTSQLQGLYDQYNPQAQAGQYDQQTAAGRNQLVSGLDARGVSGSSFANNDLAGYNNMRDLGRSSIINQGVGTQAGIANNILTGNLALQKNKFDLYGRALSALGGSLGSKTGVIP